MDFLSNISIKIPPHLYNSQSSAHSLLLSGDIGEGGVALKPFRPTAYCLLPLLLLCNGFLKYKEERKLFTLNTQLYQKERK